MWGMYRLENYLDMTYGSGDTLNPKFKVLQKRLKISKMNSKSKSVAQTRINDLKPRLNTQLSKVCCVAIFDVLLSSSSSFTFASA